MPRGMLSHSIVIKLIHFQGIPVGCMAINGSENAAIFALQILGNYELVEKLRMAKRNEVLKNALIK